MASTETESAPADAQEVDDLKHRRRARSIVNEALLSVSTPLDNRRLGHRLLPGLWQAAVNVVLSCFDPEDAIALLMDRGRGIVGEGTNHDAPPRAIPPKSMAAYVSEVEMAARTIMESIEAALKRLQEEGLDDRFPETVFDASLQVLIPAWGPHHVRRAISEQSALLIRGVISACNFMEPSKFQAPSHHGQPRKQQLLPSKDPAPPEAPRAEMPQPPRRVRIARTVNAFAATDVAATGMAAWAAVLVSHDDEGRTETREISGTMMDPNGRAAAIRAVRECVLAACESSSLASVVIETPSEQCVRAAAEGGTPGSRLPGEESAWEEIDRASAIHRIEVRIARHAVDRELSERCDRLLRRRLEG